jgi:hypothetical protein
MMDDGYERTKRCKKRCKLEAVSSLKQHGEVCDKKEFSSPPHVIIINLSAPPKSSGDSCNHAIDYNFDSI